MKTVTIKIVVDDEDEDACSEAVQHVLETDLNPFPLYYWDVDKSNADEEEWKAIYDKDDR